MSTSSQEGIPANRSRKPGKGKAKKTRATSGLTSSTQFAQYDPDTHSWKTCEATLLSASETFSPTLPPAGILQSGRLSPRPRLALHIAGIASSSWPTPTAVQRPNEGNVRMLRAKVLAEEITSEEAEAMLGKSVWEAQGKIPALWPTPTTQEVEHPNAVWNENGRRISSTGTTHSMGLADAVHFWPTPTVNDSKNVNPKPNRSKSLVSEVNRVEQWPTPTASSWGSTGHRQILERREREGTITEEERRGMTSGNGGKLNPTWVEWLMGFPLGWTDLED